MMTITIDEQICKEHGLEMTDVMLLYIYMNKVDIKADTDILLSLSYMLPSKLKEGQFAFSENTKELLSSILISSKHTLVEQVKKKIKQEGITPYREMAREMIALYPEGKKPGTNYPWRGSEVMIADNLRRLSAKYNIKLDKDKVVEATRKYLEAYEADQTYMKLLKYFILKGNQSDLLDYMANLDNLEESETAKSELRV